jgi:hypothetical protein
MFSNVGKKCFKLWCVLCAVQFVTESQIKINIVSNNNYYLK